MMSAIKKTIHNFSNSLEQHAEGIAFRHPCLAYMMMFIGVPVFILAAVSGLTMLLVFPVALIF